MKTVYTELLKAGLVTGTHCSDLYAKYCPETKAIAEKHGKTGVLLTVFRNQISGELNYELPFCYDEFWKERSA